LTRDGGTNHKQNPSRRNLDHGCPWDKTPVMGMGERSVKRTPRGPGGPGEGNEQREGLRQRKRLLIWRNCFGFEKKKVQPQGGAHKKSNNKSKNAKWLRSRRPEQIKNTTIKQLIQAPLVEKNANIGGKKKGGGVGERDVPTRE